MTHSAQARFRHVANGTSTTRLIEAAGIPGIRSIWADPLYEGPVPGALTDAELLDVRRRYLEGDTQQTVIDPVNDLRQWRASIEGHQSYDELILWFEHDLFDQLNLVQLLTWIHECLPVSKAVSLVCIGSFPGRPRFKGLGELTPDELGSLLETRQRVSEAEYSLARRAWQAFRGSTPEALDDLRHGDTAALPFFATAIVRFLQEYPWTSDGLSRTERRLLQLADGAAIDLAVAFPRMHEGENAYYVTDRSLMSLAEGLSHTPPPLLTFTHGQTGDGALLHGSVQLTGAGRAVLTGQQDRVAAAGIDRWLGGVHLQGEANIWRWDDTRQSIAKQ